MRPRALVAVGLLFVGCVAATQAGDGIFRYKNCPRPSYSPLHYWVPTAYRIAGNRTFTGEYTYAPAHGTTHIVKFHCPSVDPFHRYMGTGLPYDPNGPFAPVVPAEGSAPEKMKSPY